MALNFGDYVTYDGLLYRIVAISDDATPEYTLEPVRRSEETLSRTITSEYVQTDLVPSGGSNLTGITADEFAETGSRTAISKALADGKIRIKFDSNDGTDVESEVIDVDGKATEPSDPTREHYTFDDWYSDAGLTSAVTFGTDTFDDDTTLYAGWTPVVYTVTYDSNDGDAVASEDVDYGDTITEPADPTRSGYLFDGWFYDDTTFEEPVDFDADIIDEDVTLYAKWVESVTVSFESNGGSAVDDQVIESGTTATEPTDPTRTSYVFDGWYYDDAVWSEPVDFVTDTFDADDTLYAKWLSE